MAEQQEGGWPLGLQPVNVRVGMARTRDFSGSISFNTLLTASPSSCSDSSSDLDTESTGSFFHDKSITLGSLIGVSSILELSRRSFRGRGTESITTKKGYLSKTWFFSLCSKNSVDTNNVITPLPSLGHFLAVERRAGSDQYRSSTDGRSFAYEPDMFIEAHPVTEPNSLFVDGRVVPPPQSSPWLDSDVGSLNHRNGHDGPVLFSCICGQPTC
ncbi:hypothetical protein AQUCO_00300027v1 [Aquilegia coerulea]|uniref:Uncharacterized protein n=1 Tax=Aquilegia coerulea TaxID=218851 RepID=A0A2G5EWT8_AQUCA|nr:hypothetical protein AQUCO_00300027v1 [Aquilegia coerulea]